ncbi:hypothetical protein Y032_0171g286, partial [Ancylostoma ceylanicum]
MLLTVLVFGTDARTTLYDEDEMRNYSLIRGEWEFPCWAVTFRYFSVKNVTWIIESSEGTEVKDYNKQEGSKPFSNARTRDVYGYEELAAIVRDIEGAGAFTCIAEGDHESGRTRKWRTRYIIDVSTGIEHVRKPDVPLVEYRRKNKQSRILKMTWKMDWSVKLPSN